MPPPNIQTIEQHFINMPYPRLTVETIIESEVTEDTISKLLADAPAPRAVGLAPGYTVAGKFIALAVAVQTKIVLIHLQVNPKSKKTSEAVTTARGVIQRELLANSGSNLYSFDMGPLAANLYLATGLRVHNAIDVQAACSESDARNNRVPANAVEFAVNLTKHKVNRTNIDRAFSTDLWDQEKVLTTTSVALKAWLASFLPTIGEMEGKFQTVKPINLDIQHWPNEKLTRVAQWANTDHQLDSKKATSTTHDFSKVNAKQNKYTARGERFQNRLRASENGVRVEVSDPSTGGLYTIPARITEVQGRNTTLRTANGILEGKIVQSIVTEGRDGPTMAEREKAATLLRMLQDSTVAFTNCFHRLLWPDGSELDWPTTMLTLPNIPPVVSDNYPLNDSQLAAVQHMLMLNNDSRITLIWGPPGSGKTTVIAAFVISSLAAGLGGLWLIAQSNVAVKNIAEKLAKAGFFSWKLLVSTDFHVGWHEHLYHRIASNIIRSDEFFPAAKELKDCKVILCTLSMLSHPRLALFTRKVHMKTLVVDEASQINVNDYISILQKFTSIHKMCFIGDDKQLPPYGQEEIEDLQSIFEIEHLRSEALMLDIQYRMPPPIGDFISDAIYEGQLRSNPDHEVQENTCWFLDVDDSIERRNGTSWENPAEAAEIIKLSKVLQEREASYRIISPYDAQRTFIENSLKEAGLNSDDKCFNVDSFQGNEDDYIIISVVRSHELGFLKDLRRTNVMLSRCKRAMYIFSSWNFLVNGLGANSLVGQMAAKFGDHAWLSTTEIGTENFPL